MSATLEALARRVEELETQLSFQDELNESLNTIVAKQDGKNNELKRQFSIFSERLKDIGDGAGSAQAQDETPPHY